jgi:putative flippase GtrA
MAPPAAHRLLAGQVWRYAVTGVANTLLGLILIVGLHRGAGVGLVPANAMGYGVGLCLSFWLNRNWTFGHAGRLGPTVFRFAAVLSVAFAINMLVIIGLQQVGLPYLIAQCAGAAVYSVIGFLGFRHVVFTEQA